MFRNPILDLKGFIKSKVLDEKILDLSTCNYRTPDEFSFSRVITSQDTVARLDVVSKIAYGVEDYANILGKLNGISNPFELNEDEILIIPSADNINDFYMETQDWDEDDDVSLNRPNTPIMKNRKDKRKPNDAVIGDARYRVDNTNKIIIY